MSDSRPYNSPLRRAQTNATREQILDATHELLQTTRPVDLGFKEVAELAGVSLRTVYRHFSSHEELFAELADRLLHEFAGSEGLADDFGGAMEDARRLFHELSSDRALFRLVFLLPMLTRSDGIARKRSGLQEVLPGLEGDELNIASALAELQTSPYAWDVFTSQFGLTTEQSFRAASVATSAIVEYLRRHPGALDPETPLPHLGLKEKGDDDRD